VSVEADSFLPSIVSFEVGKACVGWAVDWVVVLKVGNTDGCRVSIAARCSDGARVDFAVEWSVGVRLGVAVE